MHNVPDAIPCSPTFVCGCLCTVVASRGQPAKLRVYHRINLLFCSPKKINYKFTRGQLNANIFYVVDEIVKQYIIPVNVTVL